MRRRRRPCWRGRDARRRGKERRSHCLHAPFRRGLARLRYREFLAAIARIVVVRPLDLAGHRVDRADAGPPGRVLGRARGPVAVIVRNEDALPS
jgi:hypothetical protein